MIGGFVGIVFAKGIRKAHFFSPLRGRETHVQIEYRKDPLLKTVCRINLERAKRVKQGQGSAEYQEMIEGSAEDCYFCPENLERETPKFRAEIAGKGRLRLGECTVFPNLYPFAKHHAIATLTEKHYLPLSGFTIAQVQNALTAGIEYFNRVHAADEKAKYATLSWNHLPPAGASIVHPHIQLLVDDKPTSLTGAYLRASSDYYRRHRENYWLKLIRAEEKTGERFIGRTGGGAWLAGFAPMGNNEVLAVFEDVEGLVELGRKEISDFSEGLLKVLKGYHILGIESFNMSTYSAPVGSEATGFRLSTRIVSRPVPERYYTSDAGFMEALHHERILESLPEALAEAMKKLF